MTHKSNRVSAEKHLERKRAQPGATSASPATTTSGTGQTPSSNSANGPNNVPSSPSNDDDLNQANKSAPANSISSSASQPSKTQTAPAPQNTSQKADNAPAATAASSSDNPVQTKASASNPSSSVASMTSLSNPTPTTMSTASTIGGVRSKGINSLTSLKGGHGSSLVQSFSTALPNSTATDSFSNDNSDSQSGPTAHRGDNTAQIAVVVTFALVGFIALFFFVPCIRHKIKERSERKMHEDINDHDYINEFQADSKNSASSIDVKGGLHHSAVGFMSEVPRIQSDVQSSHYGSQAPLFHENHPQGNYSSHPIPHLATWYPEDYNNSALTLHPHHDILQPHSTHHESFGFHAQPLGVPLRVPPASAASFALDQADHLYLQSFQQDVTVIGEGKDSSSHRTSILPTMLFQHQSRQAYASLQHKQDHVADEIIYKAPTTKVDPMDFSTTPTIVRHPGDGSAVDSMFGSIPLGPRASSVYSSKTMGALQSDEGKVALDAARRVQVPPLPPMPNVKSE